MNCKNTIPKQAPAKSTKTSITELVRSLINICNPSSIFPISNEEAKAKEGRYDNHFH